MPYIFYCMVNIIVDFFSPSKVRYKYNKDANIQNMIEVALSFYTQDKCVCKDWKISFTCIKTNIKNIPYLWISKTTKIYFKAIPDSIILD